MGHYFFDIALTVLANLVQVLLFLTGVFYFVLSLRGFLKNGQPAPDGGYRSFAVLLPAYNEEKVIKFSIDSLIKMAYPADKFKIFVVADHCTDGTADLARALGVRVLEYSGPDKRPGKGRALKWACEQILAMRKYDALVYFDADSLAHPEFLSVMNAHLAAGEEAVQGRQLAKNTETWLARILASGHIVSNRFFQKPKYALGLSANLHGKGMCFSASVAEKYPWDETCLTEDIEMQMRLIRSGVRIAWAEDAIVYDEEPAGIRQYVKRTVRWTRGSLDTARRHLAGLWRRAVVLRDVRAFEGGIYCAQVYRLALVTLAAALIYYTRDSFNFFIWLFQQVHYARLTVKVMSVFPLLLYPVAALFLEKAPPGVFVAYFFQPALGLLRFPVFVAGVFRNQLEWDRTEHTSQVAISDLVE
ncbi:MAG: glycosyltransferase family 2 protein [Elusimicrobia bacterium]|nr:glycosyltransferase family 2 protein [Elusimicrobiota bacterium]